MRDLAKLKELIFDSFTSRMMYDRDNLYSELLENEIFDVIIRT